MDKFEYVLTLAEERNLTRAANRLFISQPTLTNYINRLEKELGIKLFNRSVQPIEVTEAGLIYIEDKKKIQNQELALLSKLESLKQKNNTFTIGIPAVRSAIDLPKVLQRFTKLYPQININVDNRLEESIEKDLLTGKIDVAIGMLTAAYPSIIYERLQEDNAFLLIPRSFECVSGLSKEEGTLENPFLLDSNCLNQLTMLLPRMGGGHYRMAMIMMEKYGIVPKNTVHCSNMNLLYQLAGEGIGFLFATPRPFMKIYPHYTNQIAFCQLQKEQMIQKTYLGYLNENSGSPVLMDFIRLLKEITEESLRNNGISY